MDVEVVHDQVPARLVIALGEQVGQVRRKVLLGARRADAVGHLACDDIERSDQGERAGATCMMRMTTPLSGNGLRYLTGLH